MNPILDAMFRRRAIKVFQPVEISAELREQILDAARVAPSSFNSQPYRFYWVQTPAMKQRAAELCFNQQPAATASALVVAVADIGSWRATTEAQLRWVRSAEFSDEEVAKYENRSKFAKYFFVQGWLNVFGGLKWLVLRALHVWKIVGMAPVSRQGLFKWATKNASLACENLMIAAEAMELNTCPMEGFDGRRLSKFLGLSTAHHEIVLVIAVGKKSPEHKDRPQWRRTLDATVTLL